jgi:lysine decarboxylase
LKGGITELKDDRQSQTPFFTKLKEYAASNPTPFDVPGHKLGRINQEMIDFTGQNIFLLDSNAPLGLDTLGHPTGVIKEAMQLAAEAFHAKKAYFLVNGTTVGILAMIMTSARAKEKIIMPRNVHKSVINALILSGAMPVFIKPDLDSELGIANGISFSSAKRAIDKHPDAKAIFIINPTYFGLTSEIEKITEYAHDAGMLVLADEAHGADFYFNDQLPICAMDAGVDISATSVHKTAGSLTQSSMLLTQGDRIDHVRLQSTLNMLQSTSPSSLLIASLDVARKQMYFEGKERIDKILILARKARKQLQQISGITVVDPDYVHSRGNFEFDELRLIIKVSDLGITGFEAYKELRRKFNIQLELAESHLILAVLTMATTKDDLDNLILAMKDLSKRYYRIRHKLPKVKFTYSFPETYSRPRDAYHAPKLQVPLAEAGGEIAAEMLMIYPPGIPLVIPGEIISEEVLEDIKFYIDNGSVLHCDLDNGCVKVVDKENWPKWEGEEDEF